MAKDPEVSRFPIFLSGGGWWLTHWFILIDVLKCWLIPAWAISGWENPYLYGWVRFWSKDMSRHVHCHELIFGIVRSVSSYLATCNAARHWILSGLYGLSTSNQSSMSWENLFCRRPKWWMDIYLFNLVNLPITSFPAVPVFRPWLQEKLRGQKKS